MICSSVENCAIGVEICWVLLKSGGQFFLVKSIGENDLVKSGGEGE